MERTHLIQMKWLCMTLFIMFILPFIVAKFASADFGMALCLILFYVVNPIYSIVIGWISGKNIRTMWNFPIVSSIAFLAGSWLFFDIRELWFLAYAGIYLGIGIIVMIVAYCINRNKEINPK